MSYWLKKGRWLLLLAGSVLSFGCVRGPLPEKSAWPWESTNDFEKTQTGNFFSIRGNVATFDEPPKAVKPVRPEDLEPHSPAAKSPETSGAKTEPPLLSTASEAGTDKVKYNARSEYDFTVHDIKIAPPSYLPMESVRSAYDITAFNHGNSPVSVTIGIDPESAHNMAADRNLPFNSVVMPNSAQVLVHIGPKMKSESYNFRTTYSWSIGDYTASHNCPEHYQFPFGNNVRAFASVSDNANTAASTRYAVIFSMPAGTPVLVARKGAVVQIRADRIDILHDDATIATYGHLGKISENIVAGMALSAEDVIGVVGPTADNKEGYLQLTVWRPEPLPIASLRTVSQSGGFDYVSFPLEFCSTDSGQCRVISQSQMVARKKMTGARKQDIRKLKTKSMRKVEGT